MNKATLLILRNAKLFFKVSKAPFARGKDIKNNQTYFNFILQKVRDFLYLLAFSFLFLLCVNTKTTYKTKTDTKGNTKWKQTHSKDKFLNLNSDPNVGLPTSRVFGTLGETGKGRLYERERERERNGFHFRNKCFQFGWAQETKSQNSIFKRFISTTFWFSRSIFFSLALWIFYAFAFRFSRYSFGWLWFLGIVVTMKYLLFKFRISHSI